MSRIVKKHIAFWLKEIRYDRNEHCFYYKEETKFGTTQTVDDWNSSKDHYSAPQVNDALNWLWNNKGIKIEFDHDEDASLGFLRGKRHSIHTDWHDNIDSLESQFLDLIYENRQRLNIV